MLIDTPSLFLAAALVAATLGLLMLVFWHRERIAALAWWGLAYVAGGFWLLVWTAAGPAMPALAVAILHASGFIAWGMNWTAARVYHGRKPLHVATVAGAAAWLVIVTLFNGNEAVRLLTAGAIVSVYAALTAHELWRERRTAMRRRWATAVIPVVNGAALMLPVILAELDRAPDAAMSAGHGWLLTYVIELVLYAVGTVFMIARLVADRIAAVHKTAAMTDPLTGILNRRGFTEAAELLRAQEARGGRPVSVLIFDLDHFKGINDRFGHLVGDDILKLFADTLTASLRVTDVIGRLGGEEFVALLPCAVNDAGIAAERVRAAFADCGACVDEIRIDTTVSIGAAGASARTSLAPILAAADAALIKAKQAGRNRIELARDVAETFDRMRLDPTASAASTAASAKLGLVRAQKPVAPAA